jgi:hypothetical protein
MSIVAFAAVAVALARKKRRLAAAEQDNSNNSALVDSKSAFVEMADANSMSGRNALV